MDNQFSQARSTFSAAQYSSKSFSSSTFSSSNQTSLQSQEIGGIFSKDVKSFDNLPSDFKKLSFQNNKQFSSPAFDNDFKSLESRFGNNFPQDLSRNFEDTDFNLSLSQKQSSQYSKRSVTSTASSKLIRKKIVRKVINGEVVEEEEEIDEIENEPVTTQFVEENGKNDVTRSAILKQGGKQLFNVSQSKSFPEIKDKTELRNKPKAIEPPKDRTSRFKSIFGFGKKKKKGTKDVGNIQPIIDELLRTEAKYVEDLRIVVEQFMCELDRPDCPTELKDNKGKEGLFGNVEIIYMFHDVQFLTDLKEAEKNPEDISNCFLKNKKEFSMYRHFNRNQPNSELYLGKYSSFFEEKKNELKLQDIRSFLIKPTQRLCMYTLLLEQLLKECEKHKLSSEDTNTVRQALELVKGETRLGNDLMALDAIKDCHMDLKDQGDLIYRDPFTVKRGDDPEFKAMVFLFEKIILFTKTKLEGNLDVLYYQDFIYLKDIGLTEYPNDSNKFQVWFKKHTLKPYTMKTHNQQLKIKWVQEIRAQLQAELEKNKQEQQQNRRTLYDLKDIGTDKKNINIIH